MSSYPNLLSFISIYLGGVRPVSGLPAFRHNKADGIPAMFFFFMKEPSSPKMTPYRMVELAGISLWPLGMAVKGRRTL